MNDGCRWPRPRSGTNDARQRRRGHRQGNPQDAGGDDQHGDPRRIDRDPAGLPGATHLLSRVIDRGTATRSAADIADDLEEPRHLAEHRRDAARVLDRVHVPVGAL